MLHPRWRCEKPCINQASTSDPTARLCARHIGATMVRSAASGMSGISNTTVAPSHDRAEQAVGDRRRPATSRATSSGKQPRRVGIVGLEADGDQRVLRRARTPPARRARCRARPAARRAGPACAARRSDARPRETSRPVPARRWCRAAPSSAMARARSFSRTLSCRLSSETMPSDAKRRQHRARSCAYRGSRPSRLQPGDALLVARRYAGHEPRAEDLLHLGEAAVAQRAREAHDGRGLHLGPLRHFRDRAERHVGRMVQRELGDHPEPVREARMPPRDLGAQGLVGRRAGASRFGMLIRAPGGPCGVCKAFRGSFISLHNVDGMFILWTNRGPTSNGRTAAFRRRKR